MLIKLAKIEITLYKHDMANFSTMTYQLTNSKSFKYIPIELGRHVLLLGSDAKTKKLKNKKQNTNKLHFLSVNYRSNLILVHKL